MPRRLWLSAGLLAAGAALLATARLAGASPPTPAIFRVGMAGASVQIDPQVSYVTTGWWLEYATAATLYNWTDRGSRLVPEVASRVAISNRGRTYTFVLRRGFRFSDGAQVTAKSFVYAFDRIANRDLASPAEAFVTDVKGVRARGTYTLVIRLARPDPYFLSRLTLPFFQASSTTLPLNREITAGYPSAGPYFFAGNDVNTLTSIRRNTYWRGNRPARLAGLDIHWNLSEEEAFQQVEANRLDESSVPAAEAQEAAKRYGVNKKRFWVKPTNCLGELLFNRQNALFGRSLAVRKAVNWAVGRTAYAGLAGPFAGTPWTHLLPPLLPGSIAKKARQPYSVHANLSKARKLAGAYAAHHRITVGYRSSGTIFPAQAQLVHDALVRVGFKPRRITMKGYTGGDLYTAMGTHGSDLDMGVSMGYCGQYQGSYGVLRDFVADSPTYLRKVEAARKRPKALGRLDLEITRNLAPAAVMLAYNNRYFFSDRVDPRSLAYSRVYQDWSIPALALK